MAIMIFNMALTVFFVCAVVFLVVHFLCEYVCEVIEDDKEWLDQMRRKSAEAKRTGSLSGRALSAQSQELSAL